MLRNRHVGLISCFGVAYRKKFEFCNKGALGANPDNGGIMNSNDSSNNEIPGPPKQPSPLENLKTHTRGHRKTFGTSARFQEPSMPGP